MYYKYHFDKQVRDCSKSMCHFRLAGHYTQRTADGVMGVSAVELDFWECVQDFLQEEFAHKEITVEGNPSSNIHIADIPSVLEHPLFRMSHPDYTLLDGGKNYNRFNIRKTRTPLCINTDDPSMFNTSLVNEFRLLKHCAKNQREVSDEVIDTWLEKLRKTGVDLFDRTHILPWIVR